MGNKILGVACLALCAANQVVETGILFSVLFLVIGTYEFIIGDLRMRGQWPPKAENEQRDEHKPTDRSP